MPNAVVTLLLRTGTEAALSGVSAAAGELLYTSDTKHVLVSDGTNVLAAAKPWYGTAAGRPAPGIEGRLYWASDTNAISYDTGAAWTDLTALDYTPTAANRIIFSNSGGVLTDSALLEFNGTDTLMMGATFWQGVGTSMRIGKGTAVHATNALSVGEDASANTSDSTAIGYSSSCVTGINGTAIGANTSVVGDYGVALGDAASAAFDDSIAIRGVTTAVNQMVVGRNGQEISDVFVGRGVAFTTGYSVNWHVTGGSGVDASGGDFTIRGGRSTGAAAGGSVILQTSLAGGSGSSENAWVTAMTVAGTGIISFKNYTFPLADGTLDQVLTTNGAGVLAWADASGGGFTPTTGHAIPRANVGATALEDDGNIRYDSGLLLISALAADKPITITMASGQTGSPIRIEDNLNTAVFEVLSSGDLSRDGGLFLHTTGGIGADSLGVGAGSLAVNAGDGNTAFGKNALLAVSSGDGNTALGAEALKTTTVSNGNTCIGYHSGMLLSTGSEANTAIGYQSLGGATSNCDNNTAIGYQSLSALLNGDGNVSIGYRSGWVATGSDNVFVGSEAALLSASGARNVIIGAQAGDSGNHSDCVFIGCQINPTINLVDAIAIGSKTTISASNRMVIGGTFTQIFDLYIGAGETSTDVSAANKSLVFHATGGSGTDNPGGGLTFAAGRGTGTGLGGHLIFQTATPDVITGSSLNALVTRLTILDDEFGVIIAAGGLPSSPAIGTMLPDSGNGNVMSAWNGSSWDVMGGGGGGGATEQSQTLLDNQASAVASGYVLDKLTYRSSRLHFSIRRGSSDYSGDIIIIHDGTTPNIDVSGLQNSDPGITFSVDISGNDIRLLYTSTSTGSTASFKYFEQAKFTL